MAFCDYYSPNASRTRVHVGFVAERRHQLKAVATEGLALSLDVVFDLFPLEAVYCEIVGGSGHPTTRMVSRVFQLCAELPEHAFQHGCWVSMSVLCLTRDRWQTVRHRFVP